MEISRVSCGTRYFICLCTVQPRIVFLTLGESYVAKSSCLAFGVPMAAEDARIHSMREGDYVRVTP